MSLGCQLVLPFRYQSNRLALFALLLLINLLVSGHLIATDKRQLKQPSFADASTTSSNFEQGEKSVN
jgi:hypothetical protein